MPCYSPLQGYRSRSVSADGKRPIVFNRKQGYPDLPVTIPCGQCIGCRLERSRQWAIRCLHEASLYEENSFLTLTYNDDNLPIGNTLVPDHHQRFMKRLRKYFPQKLRFYHCGEYGDLNDRPHYHALIFNLSFPDLVHFKNTANGDKLYTSEILHSIWGKGHCLIGNVTFKSAAYTARYILKKITGNKAEDHYTWICPITGEIHHRIPEYTTMSRRPGIGSEWLKKFNTDVFPDDFIVVNGKKMRTPKYYDLQHEQNKPQEHKKITIKRKQKAIKHACNNTPARLKVRETVQLARLKLLPRNLNQMD
jgi:hypothetical protein